MTASSGSEPRVDGQAGALVLVSPLADVRRVPLERIAADAVPRRESVVVKPGVAAAQFNASL
jgi:hypothetical protein